MIKVHAIEREDSIALSELRNEKVRAELAVTEAMNRLYRLKNKVIEKYADKTGGERRESHDYEPYEFDKTFENLTERG